MEQVKKQACYDDGLRLEAYRLTGFCRPFPNHFHPYYVIGLVERGSRRLTCMGQEHTIGPGGLLLLNPGDSHACTQSGGQALDYLGLNLPPARMEALTAAVTGTPILPHFPRPVVHDGETAQLFRTLHGDILTGAPLLRREEALHLLISALLPICTGTSPAPREDEAIRRACAFMEEHYAQPLHLEEICRSAGLSSSALLRAFTRSRGVTPYLYLQNIRIAKGRQLLEGGCSPAEAALLTGFSDQSHFTNYFTSFIGLSPGAYRDLFLPSHPSLGQPKSESEEEREHGPAN